MELPTESKIFIVYGSLRKGGYNFERFSHGVYHVGTLKLNGFRMFDLGAYPACVRDVSNKAGVTITCDVLLSRRRYIAELIDAMERGAGYEALYQDGVLESVTKEGHDRGFKAHEKITGRIYVMPGVAEDYPEISGDWMNKKLLRPGKKKEAKLFGVEGAKGVKFPKNRNEINVQFPPGAPRPANRRGAAPRPDPDLGIDPF